MKRLTTATLALLILAGGAMAQDKDGGKDSKSTKESKDSKDPQEAARALKRLEGKWMIAQFVYNPTPDNKPVAELLSHLGRDVEIKDQKLQATEPGKTLSFDLDIDVTAKPKTMDLHLKDKKSNGKGKDKVFPGIYALEGRILSLTVSIDDNRPKSGEPDHKKQILIVLVSPNRF